ncbi:MAG: OB-fold nucleic acid binding domain-containing protein, partial [Thermoproteota archaeon]|nr:OB-fold nucleic acid binding domain-containing protein [Thermoproteota archaeon]
MSDPVLQEEDIGNLRRTHYSLEINSKLHDNEVTIMGWVSSIRDHGSMKFITITDRHGNIQVVAKRGECSNNVFSQIQQLREHTSVAIRGIVKLQGKAPGGLEVIPLEIKVFSMARKAAPFMIQSRISAGIDTRLDLRAVDLRRNSLKSIFCIRSTALTAAREFLMKEGFIEVNT